ASFMTAQRALQDVQLSGEVIMGGTFVQIGQPAEGQGYMVEPGGTLQIMTHLLHNDTFQGASMSLPGFSYQSFASGIGAINCSGSGGNVNCTGSSAGEHEVMLTFTAPMTPGTYNGTYAAEACGPWTPQTVNHGVRGATCASTDN